ncbi:MAG TPA: TFIIB-type zinc ribbon-containing protein, partial [Spirochaetia bacterium]|nr:TFIIB-type zinc ribbon-containing protein [Spirochaetia bacterium]
MQGVQGYLTSGAARLAAYEQYAALGTCPECRGDLTSADEERGELVCSGCGIVVGRATGTPEDGATALSVSKRTPLGSYIVGAGSDTQPLKGPAFGLGKINPNIIGRGGPMLTCSLLTNRVAERLSLPKSVVENANFTARRLLPGRKAFGASIYAISAYSLLHACRSAGIARISYREIVTAYADAGHKVGRSQLMRIGLDSPVRLPHANKEELVRVVVATLQSSERVAARLREEDLDPKEYFTTLLELAKEVAAGCSDLRGFSPRTVAAGSVYLAARTVS